MDERLIDYMNKEQLRNDIEELRDILNEICLKHEQIQDEEQTLIVSQQLDKLILKYMTYKGETRQETREETREETS
jgi:hypothetical protein